MGLWKASAGLSAALLLGGALTMVPASAQQRLGSEIVDSPEVWRAFQPLVKACGGGDAKAAVRYLQQSSSIVRKADAQLERDKTTETFRKKAIESLEDFDLAGFLKLLPEQSGEFRRFAFKGAPAAKSYKVTAVSGTTSDVNAKSTRRAFGDSSGAVRMRKLNSGEEKHFAMEFSGGVGIGDLPWSKIVDGLSDVVSLFERAPLSENEPLVLRAADNYLKKTQASLTPSDRAILASAWSSYPELAKLLVELGRTEDVIDEARSVEGATRVHLVSRWDVPGMRKHYPALAGFFEDLADLAEYKTTVTDADGNVILVGKFDTANMRTSLEAYIHDGHLVPSRDGKPLVGQTPRFERMTASTNMHFVIHRVHLYIDDSRVGIQLKQSGDFAEISASSRNIPKVRVKGAAFGVVPASVLDWFIPGDIEGLTKRLFETASKGNGGRGTTASARFASSADKLTTADGDVAFEVLDSALIRMGMAIIADRVVPDEEQEEDIRRLAVAYRDAFDKDLARFAEFGK